MKVRHPVPLRSPPSATLGTARRRADNSFIDNESPLRRGGDGGQFRVTLRKRCDWLDARRARRVARELLHQQLPATMMAIRSARVQGTVVIPAFEPPTLKGSRAPGA